MSFNGVGLFTRIYQWVNDEALGLNVDATRTDTDSNDIAAGLSNCVTRDGQSPWVNNLPAGGFKLTGLGVGSMTADSVNYGQVFVNPVFTNASSSNTVLANDNSLKLATTAMVQQVAFSAALPAQPASATLKHLTSANGAAAWSRAIIPIVEVVTVSDTWICPPDVTRIEVWGTGAGASGPTNNGAQPIRGGNGGTTGMKVFTVVPGVTYTRSVGVKGAQVVTANTVGNPGAATSFSGPGIPTMTCPGGTATTVVSPATGADISIPGGVAHDSVTNSGTAPPGGASYWSGSCAGNNDGVGYGSGAGGVLGVTTSRVGVDGVIVMRY